MATSAYIHFQGQCAEALAFYAEVFGGTGLQTMRYADGPGVPEAWTSSSRVMHGQVTLGDGTLMASDFPPGVEGEPQAAVSVAQTMSDPGAAGAAFDRLADGGSIIERFGPTFFSPGFGMVRDRFGTAWIITTDPAPASGEEAAEPEAYPT